MYKRQPEEMKKPMVGIVSSFNEIVPGHMNIDKIVEAVKLGVAEAGGVPVVFPAIAVCDGIAMGHVGMKYSLVTRDLIADSTECMAIAHQFDALVMVPNCDKNVPGLLMAAARLNLPTVFVSDLYKRQPLRTKNDTSCLHVNSIFGFQCDSNSYDNKYIIINSKLNSQENYDIILFR